MEKGEAIKGRDSKIELHYVEKKDELPQWTDINILTDLFHRKMEPYQDKEEDVRRALNYAFSKDAGKGGFLVLATTGEKVVGATLILKTGMVGYVPENLLLFVVVEPEMRGKGVGRKIMDLALSKCEGDIKLHVDFDNPARRLYERIGFKAKYVDMRYSRS